MTYRVNYEISKKTLIFSVTNDFKQDVRRKTVKITFLTLSLGPLSIYLNLFVAVKDYRM